MKSCLPSYVMFAHAGEQAKQNHFWHFRLRALDGADDFEAADTEPYVGPDRLELMALVRGLEALEQPSSVTLVTPSRYLREGISYGLPEWRQNEWRWERFGEYVPIKNADLWRRVDRAMQFHRVKCGPVNSDVNLLRNSYSKLFASVTNRRGFTGRLVHSARHLFAFHRLFKARAKLFGYFSGRRSSDSATYAWRNAVVT